MYDGKNGVGLEKLKEENEGNNVFWDEEDVPLKENPKFNSPFIKKY